MSEKQTQFERRSSRSGIKSGGRRKSDRKLIGGGGKKARIGIAISFFVSACILVWAFTLPFRGGSTVFSSGKPGSSDDGLQAQTVSHSPDRVSNDDYIQQMLRLEDDLKTQLAAKQHRPKHLPGKKQARAEWERGLKQRLENAKLLAELADGEIEPGTIEWHAQQEVKQYLQDVPQ